MTILLNLSYNTVFGEELVVNLVKGDNPMDVVQQKMSTLNGSEWTCRVNTPEGMDIISYFYSVEKNGVLSRQEWQLQPHILRLSASKSESFVVYDHWNDIPEDAYMYSSAITDCVAKRAKSKPVKTTSTQAIVIKTKAPQLRSTERLAIMGEGKAFGEWESTKALQMEEFAPNEWMAVIDAKKVKGNRLEFKFVALDEKIDYTPLWETRNNRTIDLPELKAGESVVYELDTAFFPIFAWKAAGVVVPIFSLRSEGSFGVGDFGDLKMMVDWAAKTNQRVIQILPIYDTTITNTWTDSYPYSCISIFALNPIYVDLRQLPPLADAKKQAEFEALRQELNALPAVDYERVIRAKEQYLHLMFEQESERTMRSAAFKKFFRDNERWLVPYAQYSYLRDAYGTADFNTWPSHREWTEAERGQLSNPRTKAYKKLAFFYYVQFVLDQQMCVAHEHAMARGVILKGDIPIGVDRTGCDVWFEPHYFNLDGQAGAPPDAFAANGQNWGFPTYNWDRMLADGCQWWVRRFRNMAKYFDAYRIDHVLGFFRIWDIPADCVHALLGQFSPALPMTKAEIGSYGFEFDEERHTRPFINKWVLERIFGERADEVAQNYLQPVADDGTYSMRPEYDTERKVQAAFAGKDSAADTALSDGLYKLIENVLFVRDRKRNYLYHPRITAQLNFAFAALGDDDKQRFNRLYDDYYYRRNSMFWYREAMKKLPRLVQATRMLVCAEDLGMVPESVDWVMKDLRILSLNVQTMPKEYGVRFADLSKYPYRSVCLFSSHDMPTLRLWWDEDLEVAQDYYETVLYHTGAAPHPLPGWLAREIVVRQMQTPSMLCIVQLQDWLATDERIRQSDPTGERVNVPANPFHYWRYRMPMTIESLKADRDFVNSIKDIVGETGRY